MTTIAYRDGLMAADSGGLFDGLKSKTRKIYRAGDALIGGSGNFVDILMFREWWEAGQNRSALPEFRQYGEKDGPSFAVLVAEHHRLTWWSEHFQPEELVCDFWAVGSGAMAAMAAMYMGADAFKAVEVAVEVDYHTNGDVQVERLAEGA